MPQNVFGQIRNHSDRHERVLKHIRFVVAKAQTLDFINRIACLDSQAFLNLFIRKSHVKQNNFALNAIGPKLMRQTFILVYRQSVRCASAFFLT